MAQTQTMNAMYGSQKYLESIKDEREYNAVNFVYGFFPFQPSACRHYRMEVPLQAFGKLGLSDAFLDAEGKGTESLALVMGSDIYLVYALGGKGPLVMMNRVRGEYAEKIKKALPRYVPPAFIHDLDDNIDWVHPLNPAFVNMGIRNIDGELLEEGDTVWVNDVNEKAYPLWIDRMTSPGEGKEVFDIYRNKKFIRSVHDFIKKADGLTVSCDFLADYYVENYGVRRPYVYPNSIIPGKYPQVEFKERETVRILWQGGASHAVDLFPIRDALVEIAKKHPNVKIVMWGMKYDWVIAAIPPEQVEFVDWVPYEGYPARRATMDCDINLCPVTDNIFARSKSAIKWYEASILAVPEVTLAADVGPYKEIKSGETGLLYTSPQDFVEKATILVENKELRRRLAENAKKEVLETRDYKKTAPALYEYYKEVRARQIFELGAS